MHMNAFYLFSLVHLLLYERSCSDFFSPSVSSHVTGSPLGTTATPVSSNSREVSQTCSLPPLASPGVPEQSLITSAKCRTSCLSNVSLVQCQTFFPSFACVRVCVCVCVCVCGVRGVGPPPPQQKKILQTLLCIYFHKHVRVPFYFLNC